MRNLHASLCAIGAVCWLPLVCANPVTSASSGPQSGIETVSRLTIHGEATREFDWAKSRARAQIVRVSSGPRTLAGRMIDDDTNTVFRFSPSDRHPTVIIELAKTEQLHRIAAILKSEHARLEVFLLDSLPKNDNALGSDAPIATVAGNEEHPGGVSVSFGANGARYVALRWTRTRWDEPFEVAEISAWGQDRPDLDFALVSSLEADAGQGATTLAVDPPALAVTSP